MLNRQRGNCTKAPSTQMSERVAYRSLLNFLWLLSFFQEKCEAFIETIKNIMNEIKKVTVRKIQQFKTYFIR
jgi:hypothetical protein